MKPIRVPVKPYLMSLFPNASQSTADRNPLLGVTKGGYNAITGNVERKRGILNNTEAEFALMLEAQKRAHEILRYDFEGITLRWNGIKYTPDFVVSVGYDRQVRLIEIKGAFIKGKFERAAERFRHAKTYWPEFAFEMWQKTKHGWKRKF